MVPPSMPWTEAIRFALLMCVFAIITMFCVVSLGMTWVDAKGGASGNLPTLLRTDSCSCRICVPSVLGTAYFVCETARPNVGWTETKWSSGSEP
ncbi:hypothetical protein RBSH_05537 [Rhodopirellula baltica SH28]|uniref:Uncharacterized protein n=1 Tax=Rhodopirellula baltica SH28 TaxID=993517 RepID=K5D8M0_RHOBT|nr:hypothetical protein RBSH_05537 [Rhodopirellula baltica SH28]